MSYLCNKQNFCVTNVSLLPEAFLALRVLSSPVSVCVYLCVSIFACPDDDSSHVSARITWFGWEYAKHFALGPYCFGGWLSLSFHVKFNFILKLCLFASLLRLWNICETCKNGVCWTVPHRTWCRTHSDSFKCTPTGSCQTTVKQRSFAFICSTHYAGIAPRLVAAGKWLFCGPGTTISGPGSLSGVPSSWPSWWPTRCGYGSLTPIHSQLKK